MTPPFAHNPPAVTLLCARFHPDRHGGVETHMLHAARALARAGAAVQVLTENRVGAAEREELEPNLVVERVRPFELGPLWRWPHLPRAWQWARAIRRHARPGVIWANDPSMACGAMLAGRRADLLYHPACCTTAMDGLAQRYPVATTLRMPWMVRRLERYAYRRAPLVVVTSDNVGRQFHRAYGLRDHVHVVALGVEPPRVRPDRAAARGHWLIPDGAMVIGFVGRLDPCKDVGLLFDAATRAHLRPQDRLLIVGDGPDRDRLLAVARQRGLRQRIIWAGALADPWPAYAAMDVFVLPSLYEAFGLAALEAMAMGVPVLARQTDRRHVLTASDEFIADGATGLLFLPHDAGDLAAKLRYLRRYPERRKAMGLRAAEAAQTRSWDVAARAYLELFETVRRGAAGRGRAEPGQFPEGEAVLDDQRRAA